MITLYLKCGILKWVDDIRSNKIVCAKLILICGFRFIPRNLVIQWQLQWVTDKPNEYSGDDNVTVRSHVTRMDTLPRWDTEYLYDILI